MDSSERPIPETPAPEGATLHPARARPTGALDLVGVLGAAVQISPLAMVLTDPNQPDCPMVFCNQAFVELTGYSADEAIGRNCRFLQGAETDQAAVRALGDAYRAGKRVQVDMWNYRKDGSRFWNSMFIGPVHDAAGTLLYWFGSQTDSSARRAGEEAAHREHRMDTLGAMAAGMAHEVNNLMTVVVGNVELLHKAELSAKQSERLGHVAWAAGAAGKLTQQMLSFAGRQGLQPVLVDLNDVLRGLDQKLGQIARPAPGVQVVPYGAPLLAEVDVGQLELALLNLVRNASDASPSDAPITLAAGARQANGAAWAEIAVTDSGTGMTPEVAARAIDPFFTTKEHGRGTGLGLSMAAGFCRQSGGRLSIQTEAGRGTTVCLSFPRQGQAALPDSTVS